MLFRLAVAPAFALVITACASGPEAPSRSGFETALAPLCGEAFEGRIVTTDAADDPWRAERVVMHVRGCEPGLFEIPLHVGENRSRTWVLMQVGEAWELRHDHRHDDGEPDSLTLYGGFSASPPDALRQEFPADEATKALFDAEGIPVSKTNVWAIEIDPGANVFAYELKRPERHFRLEFDTSRPVDAPPAPWGWD
ncbi:MAG: hypothetical protein IPK75_05345 [Acidobacteria bacterium]|nr:hypothetical protein [Acidobacteriota bacterium]